MTIRQNGSSSGYSQFDATSNGSGLVTSESASATPLIVRGAASQSANLLEAQNSSSVVVARVAAGGALAVNTTAYPTGTFGRYAADADAAELHIGKSRNATPGSHTIVQNGDGLGLIVFEGSDGTQMRSAAWIGGYVDGTPSSGTDMPGRLVFFTSADGSASPSERMRIDSSGLVSIGASTAQYEETRLGITQSANSRLLGLSASNASFGTFMHLNVATRAGNSAFVFFATYSSGGTDAEHSLRGDGQAYADGSWNGGGADYAEYFEWADGNPNGEDRRGIAVTLDGNKIKPAGPTDTIIGVISGNPSVVGDAAWNKWSEKYLRDDFGTYVMEDYEVLQWTDEDGNERAVDADGPDAAKAPADATVVVQQRRKLNPAYDPEQEYVSREQRPEWDCVGLMGKLRVRVGQPTDPRWIKMRDVSETVEEWLVR